MNDSASLDGVAAGNATSAANTRPGCVSAFVVLGVIGVVGLLYLTLTSIAPAFIRGFPVSSGIRPPFRWYVWLALAYDLVQCIVILVVCWGLWRMRNWARRLLIAWEAVTIAVSLFLIAWGFAVGDMTPAGNARALPGLIRAGVVLWWFVPRRKLFT